MGRLLKGNGYLLPRPVMAAREQAAAVLAAADAEAARRIQAGEAAGREAMERAFAQGLAEGRQEAFAQLTEVLVAARQDAEEVRASTKDAAIPLARRMAERVVGRALELHPSLMADIATQALNASRARSGPVILRVNPQDFEALERERPRLVARLPSAVDLQITPDEAVAPAGCTVETAVARLDASLAKQLDALERALGARVAPQEDS